ncbi:MAG TPA: S1C family serine protease [Polyangiaceae bacterium]|nr:S1C family serine protease [Polyangiaceae bacterium]
MREYRAFRGACAALASVVTVVAAASVATAQPAAPPSPPAPSAPGPASAPAAAPAAPPAPAAPVAPRAPQGVGLANAADVRQGVVRLERGGRAIGMGAVLRSDGRILTALSALGHGNYIDARFADGSVLRVRVVHSDRAWDLALLVPDGGHWTLGLRPSVLDRPESGSTLHRFRARGGRLEATTSSVSAAQTLLGRDGFSSSDWLVLSSRVSDDELGAPLFDERGEVAAVVVQACAPSGPDSCQLGTYGAPVSALKQFLRKAPPREPLPAAWLGLRGVAAHEGSVAGVRVLSVDPNGPAARAGLRGDAATKEGRESDADLIVAVQDAPVTTPEEMRDAVNRFALSPSNTPAAARESDAATGAGERRVRLLVFGSGKFREVSLPVRAPRQLPEPPAAPAPTPGAASGQSPAPRQTPAPSQGLTAPSAPADKSKTSVEAN